MAISNISNGQGAEAWRNFLIFVTRYWGFFLIVCCFWLWGVITVRFLYVAVIIALCVQFLPFLPGLYDGIGFSVRLQGFTSNPNIFGLYSGLGVLLASFLISQQDNTNLLEIFFSFSFLTLCLICLLASGNRGGWVASVGALSIFFLWQGWNRPFFVAFIFSLCSLITFLVLSKFPVPMERFNLLLSGYPSLRDEVWWNALGQFIERPFLGLGLYTRDALSATHYIYSEHNIFLSVLTALGALGFLSYILLLFLILFSGLKNRNYHGLILMAFLLSIGMFGFDFYHDKHFMMMFIIISSFCVSQKTDVVSLPPKKGLKHFSEK